MANLTVIGKNKRNVLVFIIKSPRVRLFSASNKYEVTNITDDVLTINSISGGGQIVITLVENMPLVVH
jgi:hypothetical protein